MTPRARTRGTEMAWGWRGGKNPAGSAPRERDRVEWLSEHGITPMNRSTRMWDMIVTPPGWMKFHYTERVGSFDRAKRALDLQRGGVDFAEIQWQGSKDMATGRAYDWCYCIEAVTSEDVDGRVACKCQCADCAPKGKGATATHWRKRHHASRIRAQMVRHVNRNKYGWRGFIRRWQNRIARWREFWEEVAEHGFRAAIFQDGPDDTLEIPDAEQITPQEGPPEWYRRDPEEDAGNGRT